MVEQIRESHWWPSVYEPLKRAGRQIAEWIEPKSDASMSADNYHITLELAGVNVNDIGVTVNDEMLFISGHKNTEREEEGDNYILSEREYGAFKRSFTLPSDADRDGIAAEFKDGVLAITISKTDGAEGGSHKIPISS